MSTRSTTHFVDSQAIYLKGSPMAIIYRHSDGYPEGAGRDLVQFLKECKKLKDSRLSDSSYLAAKYVVFLADMFNSGYERNPKTGDLEKVRYASKLEFISVGVMNSDPEDIEYRYTVDCGKLDSKTGLPEVKAYQVSELGGVWSQTEVKIPKGKNSWS